MACQTGFARAVAVQPIRDRTRRAVTRYRSCADAAPSTKEVAQLLAAAEAVSTAIAVDDFSPQELASRCGQKRRCAIASESPQAGSG